MDFFVYILKSLNFERFYVGSTQDLLERLDRHNQGRSKATKPYRPWEIVYSETYETRSEAVRRERQIKNRKSSEFIRQLVRAGGVVQFGQNVPNSPDCLRPQATPYLTTYFKLAFSNTPNIR